MSDKPGRYAYEGLDRLFHEKARLGIMTSLIGRPEGLTFNDLKALCALTDGNLSRHLVVLQERGLVTVLKEGLHGRPRTHCRVTKLGRRRFLDYLAELERVIQDALPRPARSAQRKRERARHGEANLPPDWVPA